MKKILIATVSKTGTTDHAADLIADVFKAQGHEATHLSLESVRDFDEYDLIVVGAPINGMMWHPDAKKFIETRAEELRKKKVALYLMSYMLDAARNTWNKKIHNSLNQIGQLVTPISIGYFKGKIDAEMPGPARLIFGLPKGLPIDRTEDEVVQKWAESICKEL